MKYFFLKTPSSRTALSLASLCLSVTMVFAEEKAQEAPAQPEVEQIDESNYRVGEVTFDSKTREIRFPAVVNMKKGALEFLIVHEHGAVHESLFRTHVLPTHIYIAMTLLNYKASKELYRIPGGDRALPSGFHQVPDEIKRAARIGIYMELEKDGETKRIPVNSLVHHKPSAAAMPPSHWVYGGSDFRNNHFIPDGNGQIAAIFISDTALINYPGNDNTNDEVWSVVAERVPALETKLTLVIVPHNES